MTSITFAESHGCGGAELSGNRIALAQGGFAALMLAELGLPELGLPELGLPEPGLPEPGLPAPGLPAPIWVERRWHEFLD